MNILIKMNIFFRTSKNSNKIKKLVIITIITKMIRGKIIFQ